MGRVSIGSIEIDEAVRENVMTVLAEHGLTVPEALQILLTRLGTDRDFANDGLVPSPVRGRVPGAKSWGDFFDRPGIDIEEPDDPPSQMREGF